MATSIRDRLKAMIAADQDPLLTDPEIDDLLVRARRPDPSGNPAYATWQPGRVYLVGAIVVPNTWNGHYYTCTTAGISHTATEPIFPTGTGATVTDASVVWTESGSDPWAPTYDLNAAAAAGWRQKAGKVSPNYSFGVDGDQSMQSDVFRHCMAMADHYSSGGSGSAKAKSMIDDFDPPGRFGGNATGFFDLPPLP